MCEGEPHNLRLGSKSYLQRRHNLYLKSYLFCFVVVGFVSYLWCSGVTPVFTQESLLVGTFTQFTSQKIVAF